MNTRFQDTATAGASFDLGSVRTAMKNSAGGDSSTGSELKAVEEACREASRTVEPLNGWNDLNGLQHWFIREFVPGTIESSMKSIMRASA